MSKTRKPFKRGGLHRLECDRCSFYAYATIAALEAHSCPRCSCGGDMYPDEVELCGLLELDNAPAMLEYRAAVESVWHGQEPHGKRLGGANLRDPHTVAMSRVVANRSSAARKRRLDALKPAEPPMPF